MNKLMIGMILIFLTGLSGTIGLLVGSPVLLIGSIISLLGMIAGTLLGIYMLLVEERNKKKQLEA